MSTIHVRRLRLGAALVLLTYLILHFSNHALGIISLDAMAAGRWWFLALWRSTPGTLALYGALVIHGLLALWLLYQRRTLRMPAWEATQYALGLMLPALLVVHVVGTRIAWWRLGVEDPYTRIVLTLWVQAPEYGARQTLTLVLAGIAAGLPIAWLLARLATTQLSAMLFDLTPADPLTIMAATGVLVVVAMGAGWLPARRASRIDPIVALRSE
jgi:adenylate cyclase